ncbi:HBL/NHE enterotoxin family protein [Streptomyces lushanensis]|uniref:HBL/NHE enterotoxin family protein n=1 Tax=Streptomyces lushanensis TaxID=1434255 RepID=UPI00082F2981|nr:HBL/NHE enterotoxin family protein [Streptomyces lushanensis]
MTYTVTTNLLSAAGVKDALQGSHGPGLAVQTYAQLVRSSVDMKVDALEKVEDFTKELGEAGTKAAQEGLAALKKINTHLAAARGHAQTWNNTLLPQMIHTNEDVRGYSLEFKVLGDAALKQLTDAKGKSDQVIKEALTSAGGKLQQLSDNVEERATRVQDMVKPLGSFQKDLQTDATAFSDDKTTVDAVLTGDKSWVQSISTEMESLRDGIKKDNWEIAGGSLMIAVGVVVGVVGGVLIATGVGAGVGLAVIGAGVCIAGGGVALTTIAGIDLHKKQEALAADQKKLTLLKGCVSSFQTSQSVVTSLASAATEAAKGAETLYTAWLALVSQLKEVVEMIDEAVKSGSSTKLEQARENTALLFQAAVKEWETAHATSDNISKALSGLQGDPKKDIKEVKKLQLAA